MKRLVFFVEGCREFESWLIAGVESLAGNPLKDGRPGVVANAKAPGGDLEQSPRDAKGWLNRVMESGYSPVKDQAPLTEMVDLELIRGRNMRSFRRLESAVSELRTAIQDQKPVATPS